MSAPVELFPDALLAVSARPPPKMERYSDGCSRRRAFAIIYYVARKRARRPRSATR